MTFLKVDFVSNFAGETAARCQEAVKIEKSHKF